MQAEDEEAATGTSSDYDYLLGMAIWSLTREKIEKLLQQAADKEAELMALLELSPIQIWNTDLDEFLSRWSVRTYSTVPPSTRGLTVIPATVYRLGGEGRQGRERQEGQAQAG